MTDRIDRDQFFVHCGTCDHEWPICKLPIPVSRFVKAARGAVIGGCPKCGAFGPGKIFTGRRTPPWSDDDVNGLLREFK